MCSGSPKGFTLPLEDLVDVATGTDGAQFPVLLAQLLQERVDLDPHRRIHLAFSVRTVPT